MKTTWTRRAANGYHTEIIRYQKSSANGRCDVLVERSTGGGGPMQKKRLSFPSLAARLDWLGQMHDALTREGWKR